MWFIVICSLLFELFPLYFTSPIAVRMVVAPSRPSIFVAPFWTHRHTSSYALVLYNYRFVTKRRFLLLVSPVLLFLQCSLTNKMASSLTRTSSPSPPSFGCFNMNCYRVFSSEKSLRAHIRHSNSCKKYMMSLDSNALRDRPYASCRETVYASQGRKGYGVESTRLNPTMSTNVSLFNPYDEFDYDAFYAGKDNDVDDVVADKDEVLAMDDYESAERSHAGAAVIDESYSSRAITKIMERIKARDCAAIKAMQHNVEH